MQKRTHNVTRFLLRHAVIGAAGACGAVALMLATDFANLRTLVMANDAGLLAICIMTAFFAITFASVQMGIALMLAADEKPRNPGGRAHRPVAVSPALSLARAGRR